MTIMRKCKHCGHLVISNLKIDHCILCGTPYPLVPNKAGNIKTQAEEQPVGNVTKDEKGKLKLSYVPASLEREVAKVREFASKKYGGPETWRENSKEQYFDALLRHVNAMREFGLDAVDSESGCTHAAHIACNVALIIEKLEKTHDGVSGG